MLTDALFFIVVALTAAAAQQPSGAPSLSVDWPTFLSRSDMVFTWNSTSLQPNTWTTSMFGGNGNVGYMVWFPKPSLLRIDVSRVDIYDDRTPDIKEYMNNFVYDQPRLPIGHFETTLPGAFVSGVGRTSLYEGVTDIRIETSVGSVGLKVFANAAFDAGDVIVITMTPNVSPVFVAEPADSTWTGKDKTYVPNPPNVTTSSVPRPSQVEVMVVQPHLKGTAHTTGVLFSGSAIYLAISPVMATQAMSAVYAHNELTKAQSVTMQNLTNLHTTAWRVFWENGGGFITMADTPFESFWYVQLYKFGSAVRAGGVVHDLEGPWFVDMTPWPDLHWDMNIQQTYVFPMTSNRVDLSATLVDYMYGLHTSNALAGNAPLAWQDDSAAAPTGASSLGANETCYWSYGPGCKTAPPSVTGNLLWVLQVVSLHGRYAGNRSVQTDVVFPMLLRALNFYLHFQIDNTTDNRIHLPVTFSPEYPAAPGPDANYDLSLYRWGLQTVIDLAGEFNLTAPNMPQYRDAISRLQLYSIDPASVTYEIYRGVPYAIPHRHYSHLFMIWPLHLTDLDDAFWRGVAERSVDLWLATPELDSMFYRPVASKMNVLLGRKAAAYSNISILLMDRVTPNTFYNEGMQGSCTETPYAAAWAIGELLVQSWNKTVDFFPGVEDVILKSSPDAAQLLGTSNASFYQLRTEGAFLASARRRVDVDNTTHRITATDFVSVTSLHGNPCVVKTNLQRPLTGLPSTIVIQDLGHDYVRLSLAQGQTVTLFSASRPPLQNFDITADLGNAADFNFWGFPSKR